MKNFAALLVAVSVCGVLATGARAEERKKAEAIVKAAEDVTVQGHVGHKIGDGGKKHFTLTAEDGTVYRLVGKHDAVSALDGKYAEVSGKAVEHGDKGALKVESIVHMDPPKK